MDAPTDRTRLRREPQRGSHDRALIASIVDAALSCHLGFLDAEGRPVVIPTIHARVDDILYIHGSAASRAMRTLSAGAEVCCTITLVDGLVVARSGFSSSMNYRSVMVFGTARAVTDGDERRRALDAIVDHVLPGRSRELRAPTVKELAATKVIALPLGEASAKVRTGDPVDDPGDLGAATWAGVIPLMILPGPPVPAADLRPGVPVPPSVQRASHRGHDGATPDGPTRQH